MVKEISKAALAKGTSKATLVKEISKAVFAKEISKAAFKHARLGRMILQLPAVLNFMLKK